MRIRLALISVVVTLAQGSARCQPASPPMQNGRIQQLLASEHVTSVSYAQIHNGEMAQVAAFGEQSAGVLATPQTLYNIASLTKPLTAEVILRLASEGKISLDEPMARYWTDPDIASDERTPLLTPRIALSHQTGFPNWRNKKTGLAFGFRPGSKWSYSGEGFQYVAAFAEKKLHTGFEQMAQETLLGPEAMTHTAYTSKPWFQRHIAIPVDTAGKPLPPELVSHFNAADLVYSSPLDYAHFMIGVMQDRGLSKEIVGDRIRMQVSMMDTVCAGPKAADCPHSVGFGLGWELLDFENGLIMMHTGKDEGLFTFAYLNRTTHDGAVIFTTGENGYKLILPVLKQMGSDPEFLKFLRSQMD